KVERKVFATRDEADSYRAFRETKFLTPKTNQWRTPSLRNIHIEIRQLEAPASARPSLAAAKVAAGETRRPATDEAEENTEKITGEKDHVVPSLPEGEVESSAWSVLVVLLHTGRSRAVSVHQQVRPSRRRRFQRLDGNGRATDRCVARNGREG